MDAIASKPALARVRSWLGSHWQDVAFVAVLVLGGFLRTWRLDTSEFLMDGAGTAMLGRAVIDLHSLPITGTNSSIGSFAPPFPVYAYILPLVLGGPELGTLFTGLYCTAAIAVTYWLCRRYLNPTIGLIAALLFAVSWGPNTYGRYIWQPNLQTPLVVWLVVLLFAGVAGRGKGWLAWALPVWALLLQAHPVTAALGPLLVAAWLLAPQTVRWRDVIIGSAAFAALFVPTVVFELTSHFFDLQAYRRVAANVPVISGAVFRQFFSISGLPSVGPWASAPGYHALSIAWDGALFCGLLYVAARVLRPLGQAITLASGAAGWRTRVHVALTWMRAPAQTRWRVDLVLLAWPSLILLAQVRHSSTVAIHYVIATYPAQYITLAVLLHDAARWAIRTHSRARLAALSGVALSAALTLVVCFMQVSGDIASYQLAASRSLGAEEADISAAQRLARQYRVGLVVFSPDYFALEPVRYLLDSRYHFGVPTQIVESGACLAGPNEADRPVLYLMSGKTTEWEAVIRATPGTRNLLEGNPHGGFFRAYVISQGTIDSLFSVSTGSTGALSAQFGDAFGVDRIWAAAVPGEPAGALALKTRVLKVPTSAPFHGFYGFDVGVTGPQGQPRASGSMLCDVGPWMAGQTVYYLIPQVPASALQRGNVVALSARFVGYDESDPTIGSLRLMTALDLVTMHYTVPPTSSRELAATRCAENARCLATGEASVTLA